jgi:hypothetical protein
LHTDTRKTINIPDGNKKIGTAINRSRTLQANLSLRKFALDLEVNKLKE